MQEAAMQFADRREAGRRLAAGLAGYRGQDVVVLGLARGGVPVAHEVAVALRAPLDVIVVRKLGVPYHPELGMGAIGEHGVRVVNHEMVRRAGVTDLELAEVERRERVELERLARRYRDGAAPVPLEGRVAVVVDDGIATGSTARAGCDVARARGAARVVLAVPVAPPGWTHDMGDSADDYVCVDTPSPFFAVGQWYADFSPTTDDEVVGCLEQTAGSAAGSPRHRTSAHRTGPLGEEVTVTAGSVRLGGHLTVPEHATGVVVFAHGSGSSRHSPRNRAVAQVLNHAGIATLLFDLLTPAEEQDRANVFDVELLAHRLVDVTTWLREQPEVAGLPVGYVGASTGAAAALWAAADLGADVVAAVVSRGGRPDLAGARLPEVRTPTLLVVGGEDHVVLDLNRAAGARLRCIHRIVVIPGATHLFEEPGTLRAAADAARDWFLEHLVPPAPPGR